MKTINLYKEFEEEWSEYWFNFIIKIYPEKAWDWNGISWNPNITMEMIKKYPEKPWDWNGISQNTNLTMEFIEKYPETHWNWYEISRNPNIKLNCY